VINEANLQHVQRQYGDFLILQVVGRELTAFAIEGEVVGPVPVLDDVEAFLDLASQRFGRTYGYSADEPCLNLVRLGMRLGFRHMSWSGIVANWRVN
jgi:hypothetical protein